jgi:hypothetical protein
MFILLLLYFYIYFCAGDSLIINSLIGFQNATSVGGPITFDCETPTTIELLTQPTFNYPFNMDGANKLILKYATSSYFNFNVCISSLSPLSYPFPLLRTGKTSRNITHHTTQHHAAPCSAAHHTTHNPYNPHNPHQHNIQLLIINLEC